MKRMDKMHGLVMTALVMGLIMLATATFKIPSPFTQGYVHLGDTMVFLGVLVLGKRNGCIAAGIGSALADVMGGYAIYAPWTLIIKGLMALVMASCIEFITGKGKAGIRIAGIPAAEIIGMVLAGFVMTAGYCIVDGVFAGNMAAGLLGVPANIGQFAVGMILAAALSTALYKTPAKKYFAYRLDTIK